MCLRDKEKVLHIFMYWKCGSCWKFFTALFAAQQYSVIKNKALLMSMQWKQIGFYEKTEIRSLECYVNIQALVLNIVFIDS